MDTWNPITGCLHDCLYCWARAYSKRLAAMEVEPYKTHGFKPAFAEWRLKQRLPKRGSVFVSDMGDMWGDWVPKKWIQQVLRVLRARPTCSFFFLTKNPKRYHEFEGEFTDNMALGATIETNRGYKVTRAPAPRERLKEMERLDWSHKIVVIEPILDFDPELVDWVRRIQPELVYIGYDNHNYRLPEPQLSKATTLVEELRAFTEVEAKVLRKAWYE